MRNVKKYLFTNGFNNSYDFILDFFDLKYSLVDNQLSWRSGQDNILKTTSVFTFDPFETLDLTNFKFRQKVNLKFIKSNQLENFLNSRYDSGLRSENTTVLQKIKQSTYGDTVYDDFSFVYNYAVNDDSLTYITTKSNYNYYIQSYEDRLKRLPEEVLPNFYVFSLNRDPNTNDIQESDFSNSTVSGDNSAYNNFSSKFDKFITLNNNILLKMSIPRSMQFFERYSQSFDDINVDFFETYKKRFSNFSMDIAEKDLIGKIEEYQYQYPMSINISFSTDGDDIINDIFKERNINGKIINDIKFSNLIEWVDKTITEVEVTSSIRNTSTVKQKVFSISEFRDWLETFINNNEVIVPFDYTSMRFENDVPPEVYSQNTSNIQDLTFNNNDNLINLELTRNTQNVENNNLDVLTNIIDDMITGDILNEMFIRNIRTIENIYDGQFSKTKTIFYKIEKRNSSTNNLIQTFYVVNIPGLNIMNYIDTQIKPLKEYSYKVHAVNIVFGTKYKYDGIGIVANIDLDNVERSQNELGQAGIILADAVITPISDSVTFEQTTPDSENDLGTALIPDEFMFNNRNTSGQFNFSSNIRRNVVDSNRTTTEQNQQVTDQIVTQEIVELVEQTPSVTNSQQFIESSELLDQSPYLQESFSFYVNFEPSIKLIELEYSEEVRATVIDNPPIYPEVLFIPSRDKIDSFHICFFEIFSEIEDYFKMILDDDTQYGTFARSKEKIILPSMTVFGVGNTNSFELNVDKKIKFMGDGDLNFIQVFFSTSEPFSYEDFVLSKTINFIEQKNIFETIPLNSDVYYFFRSIDNKNNISNPSPIYKCRLHSNGISSFLELREHIIKPRKYSQDSIDFKRYLKIRPSNLQKLYSYQNEKIGIPAKKTYNNNFLLKIKSKHTDKQINIKFKFKLDETNQ